ncbi:DUF3885 domain-containing protein [Sporolactobacillus kofuensis]|uniref:DUF3885 domain-containing protein n=1 Tax=Sporolactobacillus kofuensis TaxID=269672 RepID=A0ABW1WGM1_9BACL|nr:DUF3885 domain-containing protein [Sporolactobacillus kofuensis]MCO7177189.1 DUF3885 domain-containing protein [Sporolactobacillus kofuensis]
MQHHEYLQAKFPRLELRPPLFYRWSNGIRFELGIALNNEIDFPNNSYIQRCYQKAITLFQALHALADQIVIVDDVDDYGHGISIKRRLENFSPYIQKSLLFKLKHNSILLSKDGEEGMYQKHRFSLKCRTSNFAYIPLIKAICNHDFGLSPSNSNRVYFINVNKNTIFHIYDDRGCDLLATVPETIKKIYLGYNDWILDYDRTKIDKIVN